MGFETHTIKIEGKIIPSLCKTLNITFAQAQKFIDRKRVKLNNKIFTDKKAFLNDYVDIILFTPKSSGLIPIFQTKDFAIFDKPSGIAVHPKNLSNNYTLLDDIRFLFGKKANITHRLDKETSGLIIASKHKNAEIIIKKMFETKQIQKYYTALVKGNLKEKIIINKPILTNKDMDIKVKVLIDPNGKNAITEIIPIKNINNNTLIIAKPLTGRQHQIRVHLHSIGHPIIGEPLYGVDFDIADKYLKGLLTNQERMKYIGHHRLMLHSYKVEFNYNQINYKIVSKTKLL
jgi:23S rRNA pseudouridine1911/1915/1917 synthase